MPLSQADFGCFQLVFVFRLGGPTPSEAAGGRPQTEGSKTLGPVLAVAASGAATPPSTDDMRILR